MATVINTKQLRQRLGEIVRGARKGARYTVLYRSRPAFDILPVGARAAPTAPIEEEPLFGAPALGRSRNGRAARDHDRIAYE